MKILFLHLSDIHFKSNTALYEINPFSLVNSLKCMDSFDECVVIISGDISFSGKKEEFAKASLFLVTIMKYIKENLLFDKHIHFFVVPGNHDNLVENPKRDLAEIRQYHHENVDQYFYNDLKELDNFYDFAYKNSCFCRNKVFEVLPIRFGDFTIKFNLINTAPFSLISDSNDDKGVHHLPKKEFAKFGFDKSENFTVSIMHHSPEWFWDDSKRMLYSNLYESSDLVFVGHEHLPSSENKIVNGKYNIAIMNGVALYGTEYERGFNAIILDTDLCKLTGRKFIFDGNSYQSTPILDATVEFKGRRKFTPTREFQAFLNLDVDELSGENYLDYFVFPSLDVKDLSGDMQSYRLTTEENFIEYFKEKKRVCIEGITKSGKTILAKYICRALPKDYIPIFLCSDDFLIRNNERLMSTVLVNHYGASGTFEEYFLTPIEKRVLFVDDKDLINPKRWDSFWSEYKDKFEYIFLFSREIWDIDLKRKTLEELSDNKIYRLEICPFYFKKRGEFIQKICKHITHRTDYDLTLKADKINNDIANQVELFQLTPSFIYQYVNCYLSFPLSNNTDNVNVFNKVYEANITMRLAKVAGEENVSDIMMALEYVAYYAHFGETHPIYPFTHENFNRWVELYNKDYDNNLKGRFAFDKSVDARIVQEITDGFKIVFCDDNLLAYFVALHLNRLLIEGEGHQELGQVLSNICYKPNGDILLFLSYIANNAVVLMPIFKSISELMDSWEELNFDKDNVKYITKISQIPSAQLPTHEEKKKLAKTKDALEEEIVEQYHAQHENVYDYYNHEGSDINSFENKMIRGISYLNLIAKILPNFRSFLKGPQKKSIVSALYTYPNKLLYFVLKEFDENYEKTIDEILEEHPKTKKGVTMTREMIGTEFKNQSILLVLSIYNFIAETSSNSKTIIDLNKTEYFNYNQTSNYRIMNLLMEECALNFSAMTEKAEDLFNKSSNAVVKSLIPTIVRKFFLCHEISPKINTQHVIDTFFAGKDKRAIQLAQMQQRSIKK